ncbi:hypothetical protein VKT23_008624 [Stygiomarasmius scandens]|uniref:Alpha-type protein kinase domain-containing protein n=1 Tax=Marasmiellus scandens TaxID=2682957 RepID=A0ABR1JHV0_9AGAR
MPAAITQPDPAIIAQRVNAAQRSNASREVSIVTALGSGGPHVGVFTGAPQNVAPSHGVIPRPRATGYTPAHNQHGSQTDLWRSKAYASSGETVSVNIAVAYLEEGKSTFNTLSGFADSIRDLDANSTVPEIRLAVQRLIAPKLYQFTSKLSFSFDIRKLNLRDVSKSLNADLDGPTVDQKHPYFRSQCLKLDKKTNQFRFHKPQTPFRLLFVIPSDEWLCYEDEMENYERRKESIKQTENLPSASVSSILDTETYNTSNKRPRSASTTTPTTPPHSKRIPVPFTSPSRDQIAEALVSGGIQSEGHSDISAYTAMQGLFAPIPVVSLLDIIQSQDSINSRFDFDSLALPSVAYLQVDLRFENELGFGAFKTCHPAKLMTSAPTPLMSANAIVMKELYENKGLRDHGKARNRGRYSGVQEWNGIMVEASVHYYAVALMEFANAYIERQKREKGISINISTYSVITPYFSGIPSFMIPSLRFVQAAVFVVLNDDIRHAKANTSGAKRTYLLEERISIPKGKDFVKYIHNGSPVPLIKSDHPEYETALFLSAIQHLQYDKTHQYAYVSDFQGYGGLLSDPQIMTSP